jgi:signal peptidase I
MAGPTVAAADPRPAGETLLAEAAPETVAVPETVTAPETVAPARRGALMRRAVEQPKSRPLAIALDIVIAVLCVVIVGASALLALTAGADRAMFGYRVYTVLTGSMTPGPTSPEGGFGAGAVIVVKAIAPQDVAVGDVITYRIDPDRGTVLTHRVVEIKTRLDGTPGLWFVTRGDANDADDPPVPADRVIGKKVLSIPKIGGVIRSVQQNPVPSVVFALAAIGFIVALRAFFGAGPPTASRALKDPREP